MKLKKLMRRTLALMLTAAALAGPLAVPASRTSADTEFDIDGTAFTDPETTSATMYFWHEGLPTRSKDTGGNYIKYPVLICWGGKYFLCTDAKFKDELNETHTLQKKENNNYVWCDGYEGSGYLYSDSYSHKSFDRVWGSCDYYMRYLYDTGESSLLAKLGMDINTLKTLGEAVSMTSPGELPYLVVTKPETDQYAIGLSEKIFGKDVWLVGQTKTWERVPTDWMWGYDEMMEGEVQWCLEYQSWSAGRFCNKDYTYKSTRTMYDVNAHKSYDYSEGPDQHYWTVKKDSKGLYHFWTMGENNIASWARISGTQGKEKNRQRLRDWYHANDLGRMSLYYKDSQIGVNAETVKYDNWDNRKNTVSNTDGYTVYYAEPNIVSFHKKSFEVASGQVVNLDGPRVIGEGCTVTVKDGGVLACEGWVINNGQIIIEPGGMLILSERETLTGDRQMGAITSVGLEPSIPNGRIACDGIIIINRDCKLTCAGTYGLQLGEGAQVVNYGQIITENLEVYGDHTIENRGDTSAVFAGWGLTDSGYAITRTRITDQSYFAKGTLQKAAAVRMPADAVYGDGAARLYINSASSVTREVTGNTKGFVSGFVAPIIDVSGDSTELPASIPIYHDERYGVAYITVGSVTYQYNTMVGRWVNIENGGHETFYNYRMPDFVEDYLEGELPDGYILYDGRVVGQAVKEDLYYDIHAHVYWFGENLVDYYYEEKLGAYIHVEDGNTYFRYPGDIASPPSYSSDYIPGYLYKDLSVNFRFYTSGMQEIQAADVKPKVQKDNAGFYITVSGYRMDWSADQQMFILSEGVLPEEERYDADGNLYGVSLDQVNLDGYDLSNPNAKPKVQKDEDGYYVMVDGKRYQWFERYGAFFNGPPHAYEGVIDKEDVDLNGYTLP